MSLETPTPNQSTSTTDPLNALVWDCAALVLSNLSISDLARSLRVSKHWKDCIASWGLRQHFPEKWKETAEVDRRDSEVISRVFNKCAIEPELRERWVAGNVVSQNDLDCSDSYCFTVAGDYRAWKTDGFIAWQRLDYQGGGRPFPHRKLDFEISRPFVLCSLNLNSDGLILIVLKRPLSREYREHLLDLNTGQELWFKKMFLTNVQRHADTMIHMGPEVIYRYGDNATDIELYDVRAGTRLYSLPSLVGLAPVSGIEVHRIAGRDIIFAIEDYGILQLIDPRNGRRLLEIGIDFWLNTEVVVSCQPNESAFALISQVDVDDEESKLTKIHKFASDADGNFVDQGVEVLDLTEILDGENHGAVAIDPFRYFAVAPQYGRGCPYIWTLKPTTTEIKIPDSYGETRDIVATSVCLGDKRELGRLFPEGVAHCSQYMLSIKWNRLHVFCINIVVGSISFERRHSWTVYNFGFQHLPSGLTGIQHEGSQTFRGLL